MDLVSFRRLFAHLFVFASIAHTLPPSHTIDGRRISTPAHLDPSSFLRSCSRGFIIAVEVVSCRWQQLCLFLVLFTNPRVSMTPCTRLVDEHGTNVYQESSKLPPPKLKKKSMRTIFLLLSRISACVMLFYQSLVSLRKHVAQCSC